MTTTETTVPVADAKLERRLRRLIQRRGGLTPVSVELRIAREPLARYLAHLQVHTGTFLNIETTLTELGDDDDASRLEKAAAAAGGE